MTLDQLKAFIATAVAFLTPLKAFPVVGVVASAIVSILTWATTNEWALQLVLLLINSGIIKLSADEKAAMMTPPAEEQIQSFAQAIQAAPAMTMKK